MMSEQNASQEFPQVDSSTPAGGSAQSAAAVKDAPARLEPGQLPPYKVLLHNDDVNDQRHVVASILKITTLSLHDAELKMMEADKTGVSLLLVTHKERAELYVEQFGTFNLTVTIEPDC